MAAADVLSRASFTSLDNVLIPGSLGYFGNGVSLFAYDPVTYSAAPAIIGPTVIYDGNGNTGGTTPVDSKSPYTVGSTVGVPGMGGLVKEGYQFNGWNTVADGSGVRYVPAQNFVQLRPTRRYLPSGSLLYANLQQ